MLAYGADPGLQKKARQRGSPRWRTNAESGWTVARGASEIHFGSCGFRSQTLRGQCRSVCALSHI